MVKSKESNCTLLVGYSIRRREGAQMTNISVIDNLRDTEILESTIQGYGLFCTKDLKEGEVLGLLDGQKLKGKEYFKELEKIAEENGGKDVGYSLEWNVLDEDTIVVRPLRTKYGAINHSATPNIAVYHDPLCIKVIKGVKKGTELCLDYNEELSKRAYKETQPRPEYLK